MKAISIRQPWCWAILHAGKRVENRDWRNGCAYRGPVLLHASAGVGSIDDFNASCESLAEILPAPLLERFAAECVDRDSDEWGRWRPGPKLLRGGIVGCARIAGVVAERRERAGAPYNASGRVPAGQHVWWTGGFALVLEDVQALPFLRCKGALGLFEVPDDFAGVRL